MRAEVDALCRIPNRKCLIFLDKVAARRVGALFKKINDIICPTGRIAPIDFIWKKRVLSNRFGALG